MTYPGLGGQQSPPMNATAAGQLVPGVQPGVTSGTIIAHTVIVTGSGTFGMFVYNGAPAAGNPPIFWATSASADPFGNTIPSTVGVAGSGVFEAGNTQIVPAGTFVYSAAPGAGDLVASITPAAGTDAFGNTYTSGITAYTTVSSVRYAIQLGQASFAGTPEPGLFIGNPANPPFAPPAFIGNGSPAGSSCIMGSGASTGGSAESGIQASDSTSSGIAGGEVAVECGACLIQATRTTLNTSASIATPFQQTQVLLGAAPAAYSQAYTTGIMQRINTIIGQLQSTGVTL